MNSCPCCGETSATSLPLERPRRPAAARASVSLRAAANASAASSPTLDEAHCKVLTVGHSTRPIEVFVALLRSHGVTRLIDVRTVPRSRHNPQYNRDVLPLPLAAVNIGYAHASGLGGFRPTRPDSPNAGWRNLSFRGYADYMQTTDFAVDLASVIELARNDRVALMCAEAVPWRCHRSLIADALLVHGVAVCEIVSLERLQAHRLTPFARVRGEEITYPLADP
ncbi:MAG: DUF488 domain-containing protein [Ramlibacter sp.]|nr:DUF488 domain-containing protein [Ramlibacter sp.]